MARRHPLRTGTRLYRTQDHQWSDGAAQVRVSRIGPEQRSGPRTGCALAALGHPCPGGLVGIEVPNTKPSLVNLRSVMESVYRQIASPSASP